MPVRQLKIVSWNANSIRNKKYEFEMFLQDHSIDVALLQETWLRPCNNLKIPNYTVYRNDRLDGPQGGTAIVIRNTLIHYLPENPLNLNHTEATTVIIPTERNSSLQITSVYIPPLQPFSPGDFHEIMSLNIPTIIAGDLNSKHHEWGCRITNRKGRALHTYCSAVDLSIYGPPEPTHFGFYRPDILDIVITKQIINPPTLTVLHELSSDHQPLLIEIDLAPIPYSFPIRTNINWNFFPYALSLSPVPSISSTEDLENEVALFIHELQDSLNICTKRTPVAPRKLNLPPHLKQLIKNKNRARRTARRTLAPADRRLANRLIEDVKSQLRDFRAAEWESFTATLPEGDGKNFWRISKKLRNNRQSHPLCPLHGLQGLVYSDEDKAEAFANSMERQFQLNDNLIDADTEEEVAEINVDEAPPEDVHFVSPSEVINTIKFLKINTAPGPDGVPYKALKLLSKRGIARISNIFNAILRFQHFPNHWKHSHIIMLLKHDKSPAFPNNYRPISLLSCIGKLFERILLARLKPFTEQHLPDQQFGFRARHNTEQQVLRLVEYIQEGYQHREHTGCIFLDVAKAFDRVWHDGLIYKLIRLNVPRYMILLLRSFLSGRTFAIKINSALSSTRPIEAGVPQGSILSPLLYALYIFDFPRSPTTFLGIYADDTVIAARCRNSDLIHRRLEIAIDDIENYTTSWKIEINADKSQAVFFTKCRTVPPDPLEIRNTDIRWTPFATYLGVSIDAKLIYKEHITNISAKSRNSLRRLYPLLAKCSGLNLRAKRHLYLAIVRPQITYAAVTWAHAAPSRIRSLETIQNKAMRIITGAPWYVRNETLRHDLNLPPLVEYIRDLALRSLHTASTHPNPLLRSALSYDPRHIVRHRRIKQILL